MGLRRITDDLYINNDMPRGWVNGKDQPKWHKSLYMRWYHMWSRCRNPESSDYEFYKDCLIDDRYINLSEYVHDIQLLEDFDLFKENPSLYAIDKDKIDPNNRCYYFEHLSIITVSENSKERMKRNGNPKPPKAIKGTNIDDGSIIYFNSILEAKQSGFDHGTISKCCNGKQSQHKGYKWEYINEKD